MSDPVASFDFENNQSWKSYLSSIYTTGGISEQVLERRKRKWYKENIDNSYVIPTVVENESKKPSEKPKEEAQSRPNSNPSTSSSSSTRNSSSNVSGSLLALKNYILSNRLQFLWGLSHIFLVLNSLFYIFLPLSAFSIDCFRRAMKGGIVSYCISVHFETGNVRFSREYLQRLYANESFHYLLLCVLFLTAHPLTAVLVPLLIYSSAHASTFVVNLARISLSQPARIVNFFEKIEPYRFQAASFAAMAEIFVFLILFFQLFYGQSGFMMLFMYGQFLRGRYLLSSFSRTAFYTIHTETEKLLMHPYCPVAVRNLYSKAVLMVRSLGRTSSG
eukprot:Sdes_comp10343_c0_seq1m1989